MQCVCVWNDHGTHRKWQCSHICGSFRDTSRRNCNRHGKIDSQSCSLRIRYRQYCYGCADCGDSLLAAFPVAAHRDTGDTCGDHHRRHGQPGYRLDGELWQPRRMRQLQPLSCTYGERWTDRLHRAGHCAHGGTGDDHGFLSIFYAIQSRHCLNYHRSAAAVDIVPAGSTLCDDVCGTSCYQRQCYQ